MLANGTGDRSSIRDRVIPKTQKFYLMPPCLTLSIIRYVSRVKWSNSEKEVTPCPTPGVVIIVKRSYGSLTLLFTEGTGYTPDIGIMVRVFINSPRVRGSISGCVIPKTLKWYSMLPCLTLSIIRYGSRVKRSNQRKWVEPSPTPRCISYRKGGLWVTLDYNPLLYRLYSISGKAEYILKSICLEPEIW